MKPNKPVLPQRFAGAVRDQRRAQLRDASSTGRYTNERLGTPVGACGIINAAHADLCAASIAYDPENETSCAKFLAALVSLAAHCQIAAENLGLTPTEPS